MKIITLILAFTLIFSLGFGTDKTKTNTSVRKIKILHADPALIAMLLKGHSVFTLSPEISTVQKTK